MKVLVTGASGFVGRHLCAHLQSAGHHVTGPLRNMESEAKISGVYYFPIDELFEAFRWQDVDCIVHLAARVHMMKDNSEDTDAEYLKINRDLTAKLAEYAVANGLKHFVFLSSIKVNGESTESGRSFSEGDQVDPKDAYAFSKFLAEQELKAICEHSQTSYTVVRPPLIYGPGVGANFLSLIRLADTCLPLPLAAIKNRRSMLSVFNLCDFIACCLQRQESYDQLFLLSDGCDYSTSMLLATIRETMQRPARLFPLPIRLLRLFFVMVGRHSMADRLTESLCLDNSYACKQMGWRPPVTMQGTLIKTLNVQRR